DPMSLFETPLLAAATLAVVILGKPLVAMAVVVLLRYPVRVAFAVAVALAQIGEFSFILAVMGRELGVLPPEAMNTIVAVAIVSIVLNPPLYRALPAFERWISGQPRLWRLLNLFARRPDGPPGPLHDDPARR